MGRVGDGTTGALGSPFLLGCGSSPSGGGRSSQRRVRIMLRERRFLFFFSGAQEKEETFAASRVGKGGGLSLGMRRRCVPH